MKGIAYVEVVQSTVNDKVLTLARCRSCGYVGGHAIDDEAHTVAAAKRHGKTCKELKTDAIDETLLSVLESN